MKSLQATNLKTIALPKAMCTAIRSEESGQKNKKLSTLSLRNDGGLFRVKASVGQAEQNGESRSQQGRAS